MRAMRFLLRSAIVAVAMWFVTWLPFDVAVIGGEDTWWTRVLVFLGVGIVIEALNTFVRPILTFLSIPFLILTLGLFALLISWAILWLAAWITSWTDAGVGITLGGFWDTFWAALVLAITTGILGFLIPGAGRND